MKRIDGLVTGRNKCLPARQEDLNQSIETFMLRI